MLILGYLSLTQRNGSIVRRTTQLHIIYKYNVTMYAIRATIKDKEGNQSHVDSYVFVFHTMRRLIVSQGIGNTILDNNHQNLLWFILLFCQ